MNELCREKQSTFRLNCKKRKNTRAKRDTKRERERREKERERREKWRLKRLLLKLSAPHYDVLPADDADLVRRQLSRIVSQTQVHVSLRVLLCGNVNSMSSKPEKRGKWREKEVLARMVMSPPNSIP